MTLNFPPTVIWTQIELQFHVQIKGQKNLSDSHINTH